ncbi:MAG TPA: type IV secretory system conjugative DNA transfer family protein [Gemmataceae bacterium]|nr:type IV secretory system conjugative DNA transfer family protein [Gemmataceae bacterium]
MQPNGQWPEQELLLGWTARDAAETSYFTPRAASDGQRRPVTYAGDAPLMTCAPTGAGKGRGVLIPTLLTHPGPVIVMDVKGELFQVTSRCRRALGQRVVVLDPFQLVTARSDGLNPLDLLALPRSDCDSDSEMLASLLAVGHEFSTDSYWNTTANGLIGGLIAHIAHAPAPERHLGNLRAWLYHDDLDLAIATMLDKDAVKSRMAREQFIAYLTAPREQTRPCIRTTACSYVSVLGSGQVVETLRASSFRLQDLYDGRPLSIYIVIPPEKLESHKALLRLWVGVLLTTVMRRTTMPPQRTLFLLDECAQLSSLPVLRQAITLLRGSGLQTWTFWQDLSQLRRLYSNDWQTIVNNSGVLQVFGVSNHHMAQEWAELTGQRPQDLARLGRDEAVVLRQGQGSLVCRRPDYLTDPVFAGLFDANPRFARRAQPGLGPM